jgi:hypothetical protein
MLGLSSLKLIAIGLGLLAAVAAIAIPAYQIGDASMREEVQAAADKRVSEAKENYDQVIAAQLALTDHYRLLSDSKYDALIKRISDIKVTSTTVTNNITKERDSDPSFYGMQLPEGGQKQWLNARNLFR